MDTIDVARMVQEAGASLPDGIDADDQIDRFWPDRGDYPDPFHDPRPPVDESSGHLVLRTSNMPTAENVAEALTLRPEAAKVVEFWRALSWHLGYGTSPEVNRALSIREHVAWEERSAAGETPDPTHDVHDITDMAAFRASHRADVAREDALGMEH